MEYVDEFKEYKIDIVSIENNVYTLLYKNHIFKLHIDTRNCIYLESLIQYPWINIINEEIIDNIENEEINIIKFILDKIVKYVKNDNITIDDNYLNKPNFINVENELIHDNSVWENYNNIFDSKNNKKVQQFYSPEESRKILLNDYLQIKKNKLVTLDIVNGNVYMWRIRFYKFKNEVLNEQLLELQKLYGYNYIEIEFEFQQNLYPFYPPTVKINKPRLENYMMGKIASLNVLKFNTWSPSTRVSDIIMIINDLINVEGIIDVSSTYNSLDSNSYMDIEYKLLQLEVLMDDKSSNNSNNDRKTSDGKYWTSGVGFGFNGRNDWDIDTYIRIEQEKNSTICSLLLGIYTSICDTDVKKYINIIEKSSLLQICKQYLNGVNVLEISKNVELYYLILGIILNLINSGLKTQIYNLFNSTFDSLSIEASTYIISLTRTGNINTLELQEKSLYNMIIEIQTMFKDKKKEEKEREEKVPNVEQVNIRQMQEQEYINALKPLQYDTIDIQKNNMIKQMGYECKLSRPGIMRIGKEICVFQKSLPISRSSSVFLRTDDSAINVIQFIITGPVDTPYSNGCFLFNLVMTADFPNGPPICKIVTTGGGSVRFNPNLYNNGKVCLSLLGTWNGSAGEKWNKDTSTLLQLLVSIQSLILVENPYFNEPGYESKMHTAQGIASNKEYSENIRYRTMEWAILDQLKNPSQGFEQVVRTHFKIKKDDVLEECLKWVNEASVSNKQNFQTMYDNIKIELDRL
jgi:baculoviral IAP repeat-containing protein 6